MVRKIEITHKTIVFTVLFLLSLWFVFFIRDIILQVFIAVLIMASLNPLVTKLSKYKIPRGLSVLLAYFLVFGIIGGVIAAITPALVDQTGDFIANFPKFLTNLGVPAFVSDQLLSQFLVQIGALPGQVFKAAVSVFSNLLSVVTVLIFAFYLLLARDRIDDQLGYFLTDDKKMEIRDFIDTLELRLGGWARGELTLMLLIGVVTYAGLTLLALPFALPLAILAGLLELVPIIGPFIAAVPAVIIAFGISPVIGLATASLAFLIQQVENYVFVPKIMQKSVGVNPIVTLLALTIGARLMGILGILISVPMVITLQVLLHKYYNSR